MVESAGQTAKTENGGKTDHSSLGGRLAGNLGPRVVFEAGIELSSAALRLAEACTRVEEGTYDSVGDLVRDFVWFSNEI
jgi:hypothetical protein